MSVPKLTIGLPVYNKAPFLALALRSIFAQTFRDWELIVVDDGSTDESLSMLQALSDPRVTLLADGKNRGLAVRLNQITRMARGAYLARMDADDLMHPRRLELQLAFLEGRADIDLIGCGLLVLDRNLQPAGVRQYPFAHEDICADTLRDFRFAHPTIMGRTKWFREHPYNEGSRHCEDWQLWAATCKQNHFANLAEPLYFYREYDSYSLAKYLARKGTFAALLCSSSTADHSWFSRACALVRIIGHMGGHVFAGCLGASDLLVRNRSQRVTESRHLQLARAVPEICSTSFPSGTSAQENSLQPLVSASRLIVECTPGADEQLPARLPTVARP